MAVTSTVVPFGAPARTVAETWRDKLHARLTARRAGIELRQRYYDGHHDLPTAPDKAHENYWRLARMGQANITALVVDAKTERMTVSGIRTSQESAGDVSMWRDYWEANNLSDESSPLHDKVLTVGRAFALVWPNTDSDVPAATITPEDPAETIVAYQPGSRRHRLAALKVFVDDDEKQIFATLWLPETVHFWQAPVKSGTVVGGSHRWEPWNGPSDAGPQAANPLGVVPVVEFRCRPTLTGEPNPEVTPGVLRVQDRINKTIFDRLVLSEFQAYPQRYAIGIEVEVDATGKEINPLRPGPDRVWTFEGNEGGAAVQIGQLPAADLSQHLKAVEGDIQTLAAMTKTPVYYLMGQMVNISADAIRAAEAGLVAVVKKHQRALEGAWEEVLRLAMKAANDPRTSDVALELVWSDPENRSTAESVDAALKKSTLGVPFEQNMEDIGYSPQKIATMAAQRTADSLLAPPPATVGAAPAGIPPVVP